MRTPYTRKLTILTVALAGILSAGSAAARIHSVTMVLDGFCTVGCRRDIEHALHPFTDEMESLNVDYETSQVTFVPKEDARVQLWDIVRQLRNAERPPIRTLVLMDARVEDYSVALAPRARMYTRKALWSESHGARFVMSRTGALEETVDAAAQGNGEVSVFGEVVAYDTKTLPIFIVRKVKAAGEEWDEAEVAALVAGDEDAG